MSLRGLARSAPQAAVRFTRYSTRSTFRPAVQTFLRQPRIQLPRAFSTSFVRFDDVSQELSAKLSREIQLEGEENDTVTQSESNIKDFISQNPHWEIIDNEGEQEIVLKRKYEDEDITISFSVVDFNTPMMEGDEDEAYMDEEDELEMAQSGGGNTKGAVNQGRTGAGNMKVAPEDSVAPGDREEMRDAEDDLEVQPAFPANVNLLIQRSGKGALRVNLIADNGVFTIQNVTHLPSHISAKDSSDLLRDTPEMEKLYAGPPFQQLDEDVQSLFEQYLDARGINTALALFVPDYIDVKEQKEYTAWLSRVKEFVD